MSKFWKSTKKFLNYPVIVTSIGIILTGLVGGYLTNYWHKNEYIFKTKLEQNYAKIKVHNQAWENLYNKIFDQTSEFIVAVERVISIYEHTIINPEQQIDIIDNFNSVSNKWFKSSIVVKSQLRLLFFYNTSQETILKIENEWNELIEKSKNLFNHITDLVTKYNPQDKSRKLTQKFKECKTISTKFTEKAYEFGDNLILAIFSK